MENPETTKEKAAKEDKKDEPYEELALKKKESKTNLRRQGSKMQAGVPIRKKPSKCNDGDDDMNTTGITGSDVPTGGTRTKKSKMSIIKARARPSKGKEKDDSSKEFSISGKAGRGSSRKKGEKREHTKPFVCKIKEDTELPPETHFSIVPCQIKLIPSRDIRLELSNNMVVRNVHRSSPLYRTLLVGDQIMEVNDLLMTKPMDLFRLYRPENKTGSSERTMNIVRPWNTSVPSDDRMAAFKKKDHKTYVVIEFGSFGCEQSGLSMKFDKKRQKLKVVSVDKSGWGGHVLVAGDHILDVNEKNVTSFADMEEVRSNMEKHEGRTTLLVERAISLNSSINPSICNEKVHKDSKENVGNKEDKTKDWERVELGDDASEIGAREATRHKHMKHRYANLPSILKGEALVAAVKTPDAKEKNRLLRRIPSRTRASVAASHIGGDPKKPADSNKAANGNHVSVVSKTEVFPTPADCKTPEKLQKVTEKSGLVQFVKSYMGHGK